MSKEMNIKRKLYQQFVLDKIKENDFNQKVVNPLVVELDPTAACDLACPGCISEDLVAVGNRFPNDRLLELGEEMIQFGVKAVILIGGGEPLAHPRISQLIELLGENDVHIGITTNGTFIHRHLDAIAVHSKWTRISFDAASERLFNVLRPAKRGKSKYEIIIDNMKLLGKAKTGVMGLSFLIQTDRDGPGIETNISEIFEAGKLAKEVGCDYFEVKPTYEFRGDVPHALMKHDQGLMDLAKDEIAKLDELEDDTFSVMTAINLKYSLEGVNEPQPKAYSKCPSTYLRTTVTPSGAFVCPYWRGKENMKIGDLLESSFEEVWNSSHRKQVMDELNPSRDCRFHCLRHETNNTCFEILNSKESISVNDFDRFI